MFLTLRKICTPSIMTVTEKRTTLLPQPKEEELIERKSDIIFTTPPVPKASGFQLFEKLGSPTKIVAPMVDGSELAWRILSRRYGAELCYSPMLHSRLFSENEKFRKTILSPLDGKPGLDRPLIIQFCGNDPDTLLSAAKHVVGRCDAVDINFGCPQGIAKRGHYGSFLMEDWDLVYKLIHKLHTELEIPVTAKIRVFEDWSKSLDYAKMCLSAGAQFLTVHGRTRDMKGQKTGIADWNLIRYIRDNLPEGTIFFTNGNILYQDDVPRCLKETKCNGVMSAEGNLTNPGIFWTQNENKDKLFPRVDKFVREYFEVVKQCGEGESKRCFKTHLFKSLQTFLTMHTDVRAEIATINRKSSWDELERIVKMIEKVVEDIFKKDNIEELDTIKVENLESWGGRYRDVPYWRLQPHFRRINGVDGRSVIRQIVKQKDSKRKADEPADEEDSQNKVRRSE
ncbi:hypothetical protein FOA43_000210 [Brettanomyces nanus]|uniref:tRNA-dihydrouridine(16/17) synthase [NAD(P)(+)] n=1 Tax=Eeniella nana TaxID=13502 RepID=A0A875RSV6_EENNA|nr:uncharacterized protein FOA43_000210 [Brettanomyces nanus]QPG72907.1 hypothetical protein FOA43_000210 [Brettanomyces nanus]